MTKEFNKGREYEKLEHSMRFHLFFGYGCLIGGIIFLVPGVIFSNWSGISIGGFISLLGGLSLYLGYSEKKELKKLKW